MEDLVDKQKRFAEESVELIATLFIDYIMIKVRQQLFHIMNECREMTEALSRFSKDNNVVLNNEIIEEGYKLRTKCHALNERIEPTKSILGDKDILFELKEIQEMRKEFWKICEEEGDRIKKEVEEDRIAEKAAEKLLKMIEDGSVSSKKSGMPDLNQKMPIYG